jgi:phosphoribosylformylglycinamidine synthase
MDNFCWCSSDEPERLGQLKAAVEACYDYSIAYETPFISGKDSMFNDFKGYDENGDAIKISIPPTLLITAVSVIDDSTKAISMDAKFAGDLVYIIGETKHELGGSEYYKYISFNNLVEDEIQIMENKSRSNEKKYITGFVPQTDAQKNIFAYKALSNAIQNDLVASAQSVDVGGLAVELSKVSMAGKLGMEIELEKIPVSEMMREDQVLFSQSTGRIIVTVSPDKKEAFEKIMRDNGDGEVVYSNIGKVTNDSKFKIYSHQIKENIIDLPVEKMLESYRSTFKDK